MKKLVCRELGIEVQELVKIEWQRTRALKVMDDCIVKDGLRHGGEKERGSIRCS